MKRKASEYEEKKGREVEVEAVLFFVFTFFCLGGIRRRDLSLVSRELGVRTLKGIQWKEEG